MLVVFGTYHFWRRLVGYREDFCLGCRAPRRAHQVRSFEAAHLFWIPLLPLGFWRRWHCAECGLNPHRRAQSSPLLKFLGAALCAVMALVMFSSPGQNARESLGIGAVLLAIGAGCVFSALYAPKDLRLKDELHKLPREQGHDCAICGGNLGPETLQGQSRVRKCQNCGVQRFQLVV